MSKGERHRALASVIAVVLGMVFVWITAHVLIVHSEVQLLVVWLLSLASSAVSVSILVVLHMRAPKKQQSAHPVRTLVSAVERAKRIYSVD